MLKLYDVTETEKEKKSMTHWTHGFTEIGNLWEDKDARWRSLLLKDRGPRWLWWYCGRKALPTFSAPAPPYSPFKHDMDVVKESTAEEPRPH